MSKFVKVMQCLESSFKTYSMDKIQGLFKDFQGPKFAVFKHQIIDKKPYLRHSASKFRLQYDSKFLLNRQAN